MKGSWLLQLIITLYVVVPFIMFFLERKIHHGEGLAAVRCPVFWATTGGAIVAFVIAVALYPSGQALVSIFVFAMALPIASFVQELPEANRPARSFPTSKS